MFKNIKIVEFDFRAAINSSELIKKIKLPHLKELKIKKRSELSYFIELNSIQNITISKLDDFDYSTIDSIFDPTKLL
jgi:hypothetical protein